MDNIVSLNQVAGNQYVRIDIATYLKQAKEHLSDAEFAAAQTGHTEIKKQIDAALLSVESALSWLNKK